MKVLVSMLVFVSLSVVLVPKAEAQFVVSDPSAFFQRLEENITKAARWVKEVQEFRHRAQEAKRQFDAFTGARNLGDIFYNPAFRKYLPPEWRKKYDKMRRLGYRGAGSDAYAEFQARQQFDRCAYLKDVDERKTCEALAIQSTMEKGFANAAFDMSVQQMTQIDSLRKKINDTKDPKEIAELQARLAVEQAELSAKQTQLELHENIIKKEKEILLEQQRELSAKQFAAREGLDSSAMIFTP